MRLETILQVTVIEGIKTRLVIPKENDSKIISKSIKLTNKNKQSCQNKRINLEDKFMRIASIEAKKDKKQNFFNKHKK